MNDIVVIRLGDPEDNGKQKDLIFCAGRLRRQKQWLIEQQDGHTIAAGLIHFIDAIQDALVEDLGHDEVVVFGPEFIKELNTEEA